MITKKTRRKIDAALKAKIALEAVGEHCGNRRRLLICPKAYQAHPNQTYAQKKQSLENAARAFNPGIGQDAERTMQKVMDDLSGKIGQLKVTPLIV